MARMEEGRGVHKVFVWKYEGKRPLGRPRRRWENIKMHLQEVGRGCVDWMELTEDRDRWRALVSTVTTNTSACYYVLSRTFYMSTTILVNLSVIPDIKYSPITL